MNEINGSKTKTGDGKAKTIFSRIISAMVIGIVVGGLVYLVTNSWQAAVGGGIAGTIGDARLAFRREQNQG